MKCIQRIKDIREYIVRGKCVVNLDCLYELHLLLVRSYNRWAGDRVKRWIGGIVILASCEYDFIRVNENHVQYPSNNISIVHTLSG